MAGISGSSTCKDLASKTKSAGGFGTIGSIPNWTSGHSMGSSQYGTVSYPDVPAGTIGTLDSDDPGSGNGFSLMINPWQTTVNLTTGLGNSSYISGNSCGFNSNHTSTGDLAWVPQTDIYGNQLNPANAYMSPVTPTGSHVVVGN